MWFDSKPVRGYWRWKKINPGLYNHTTQQIWLYHRIQRSLLSVHKKNFVDLITWCGIFRLWSLKSRVSINKISKQLVGSIKKIFLHLKDKPKILTSIENWGVLTSSWPVMTSSKNSLISKKILKKPHNSHNLKTV